MRKRINLLIVSGLLFSLTVSLTAQNKTNSPYTRYGYGDLSNRSFGAGRSMGGVGIGLRTPNQINPMNPASYTSMDSMTFLFDFGASMQFSWYDDGTNKQNNTNGNVEYMAMQFPLHKQVAMSIGLMPYSHVGYKYGATKTAEGGQIYYDTYEGTGGLNQLYAGLSMDIWKKRLSIGANINYMFGSVTHSAMTSYASDNSTSVAKGGEFKINDVTFDLGVQYTHPVTKTERLVAGLTYTPKKRLNNKSYEVVSNMESVVDTITGLTYDVPTGLGIGFSYVKDYKCILAADFTYQHWGNASFADRKNEFQNRWKVSTGFEYTPNLFSGTYLKFIRYRAGLSYANSYIQVDGNDYKEFSATLGLGFPISDHRSFVNVSFEYVNINAQHKSMIDENYLRLTLSYTFNEHWFFKRKVD